MHVVANLSGSHLRNVQRPERGATSSQDESPPGTNPSQSHDVSMQLSDNDRVSLSFGKNNNIQQLIFRKTLKRATLRAVLRKVCPILHYKSLQYPGICQWDVSGNSLYKDDSPVQPSISIYFTSQYLAMSAMFHGGWPVSKWLQKPTTVPELLGASYRIAAVHKIQMLRAARSTQRKLRWPTLPPIEQGSSRAQDTCSYQLWSCAAPC